MRRSKNVGVALIGLLVVAAISMVAGSGRKPAKEQGTTVSLRRISDDEVVQILRKFPEMIPDYLASKKNDEAYLAEVFQFSEVTATPLDDVFPAARFYRGLDMALPPHAYLIVISGDRRYMMPGDFNRLLLDNGMDVTDKNIVELAKAFVVLALGDQGTGLLSYPQIAFLDATRTAYVISGRSYVARVKVQVGDRIEEWLFAPSVRQGQLGSIYRRSAQGFIQLYTPTTVEWLPGRGQMNLPSPSIAIGGDAYVEYDDSLNPHSYLVVSRDSSPTYDTVVFCLSGFPPSQPNVYVQVRDDLRGGAVRRLQRVTIDGTGCGSDTWEPRVDSTGICEANAGYVYGGAYHAVTDDIEITLEKVKTDTFPGPTDDSLAVYYCDQFFPQNDTHASTFAQYVKDAMLESWRIQVDTWGLDAPPDTNRYHQVFVNNGVNWYHERAQTGALPGINRRIAIQSNIWAIVKSYPSESSLLQVAMAHEFHHGVQWGASSDKWLARKWRWFTEGQAIFVPSVQHESMEFSDSVRYYPVFANLYLRNYLNLSPESLSVDTVLRGYPACLFWRHLFERFDSTGVADGVRMVRDCYAANVGTGNSIGRGKAAIDSAIAKYWRNHPNPPPGSDTFRNFLQTLDGFAVACYLNDVPGQWHDPNGVYSRCSLTADTAFKLGPNETDSITVSDDVPCSYGVDFVQVALNGNVDTLRILLTSKSRNPGVTLKGWLVKVYPFANPTSLGNRGR